MKKIIYQVKSPYIIAFSISFLIICTILALFMAIFGIPNAFKTFMIGALIYFAINMKITYTKKNTSRTH